MAWTKRRSFKQHHRHINGHLFSGCFAFHKTAYEDTSWLDLDNNITCLWVEIKTAWLELKSVIKKQITFPFLKLSNKSKHLITDWLGMHA